MKAYSYLLEFEDKASSNAQRIAKEMGVLDSEAGKVSTTMGDAKTKTEQFGNEAQGMGRSVSGATGLLGGLKTAVGALGVTLALSGLLSLGSNLSAAGAEIEGSRIAFQTMMGDVEKGNKTLQMLNQFANVTPFTNDEVIASGRNLVAFGIENEKLGSTLKAVGDVASGLKIPFNELSEIYGKIKVSQTVYSEDLNQLAGRGIPIFTELAKVMGVQADQVKKLASEGRIGFAHIETAFQNMTSKGGMFFGMMEKQAETFGGKMSTLEGNIGVIATKMGESLNKFLSPALETAIGAVDVLAESMKPLSEKYEEQKQRVQRLSEETEPMIRRYEELTSKANLNKEEHIELKSITEELAGAIPSAVTEWDKYGKAIGINSGKLEAFIRLNKDALAVMNAEAIAEKERDILLLSAKANRLLNEMNTNASQGFVTMPVGSYGLQSKKTLDDSDINKGSAELNAITGKGGLIEQAQRELLSLHGGMTKQLMAKVKEMAGRYGISIDDQLLAEFGGIDPVDPIDPEGNENLESITAGGNKAITINMPGMKFAETIEINPQTLQEGLSEIEPQMREFFVRLLNSSLNTATQY